MNVGELRELLEDEDWEPSDPIYIAEFGHRSSSLMTVSEAMFASDAREEDDWGKSQEVKHGLYLLLGSVGANRYPPSEVSEAWKE